MKKFKIHFATLFVIWALGHTWLFYHFGIRILYDSALYINAADYFTSHGRLEDVHLSFYALPIILLACFRWAFSGEIVPYLIFQCLVSGTALIAIYAAAWKIYQNTWAAFFSCLLFLLWIDNIQWNTVIMTESLFNSITCFLICAIAYFKSNVKSFLLVFILLLASILTRPTGIIMIVATVASLVGFYLSVLRRKPVLLVTLISLILVFSYAGAFWMLNKWDFTEQYAKGNIVTYSDHVKGTPLFRDGMSINHTDLILPEQNNPTIIKILSFAIDNPAFFLKLAVFKVGYLVSFVRPYYSLTHNLSSLVWTSFVYFFCFYGWKRTDQTATKIFILAVIIVNCCLIGISTVDWDNRFYIPMEAGLVLLAGGGIVSIIEFLKNNKK